jgi:hypothetical protein
MGLLRWLARRNAPGGDPKLSEWRRAWETACAAPDADRIASLSASLDALGLPDEEVEMELEMLAGLDELVRLKVSVAANGLPLVETGHRVVAREPCHFSTPCSMPDEDAQPSGRLIFTTNRGIFAGGARATTVPWHAVGDVLHRDRDIVLVRRDRDTHYRFRCNSFSDALCGAFLARTLSQQRGRT